MRKDLGMRKGKMIAQGAHASIGALLDNNLQVKKDYLRIKTDDHLLEWLINGGTKICVYTNSEKEMLDIYNEARDKGIPSTLITDLGKTEFGGVPTRTCCALGPWDSDKIDKITGHLKLL